MMSLRLISWNIHGGRDSRGVITTKNLVDTLISRDADVICLQEVPNFEWMREVADVLSMYLYFQSTNLSNGSGNAILSINPGENSTCSLPSPWYRRKSNSRCALSLKFTNLTVVNTHLGADPTMYEQYIEAIELDKFARSFPGRVIVTGDFNAHYASPVLRHMRKRGWHDMWRATKTRKHGYREGCTFHTGFRFQRIDYILCNSPNEIQPVQAELLDGDEGHVSDHLGILLDANIR
jgi:endonuclease/exonuclease/phosphatase family metal-dependent hydrolase